MQHEAELETGRAPVDFAEGGAQRRGTGGGAFGPAAADERSEAIDRSGTPPLDENERCRTRHATARPAVSGNANGEPGRRWTSQTRPTAV